MTGTTPGGDRLKSATMIQMRRSGSSKAAALSVFASGETGIAAQKNRAVGVPPGGEWGGRRED